MRGKNTQKLKTVLAYVAAALVCAGAPTAALADESPMPTAQATRMNAGWVPYLDPPAKPAAICLVDTGVDITPDTPADSPDGPILERSALDGGPGTDVAGHGTYMAMAAGAPVNGWGTVGTWPGLRIVAVRAMPAGSSSFPFDDYELAIAACSKRASTFRIVAVNLSLGCACTYNDAALKTLSNRIGEAHEADLDVVASAGNSGGAVGVPAALDGVFAVGAADEQASLCSYSNRGDGLDLIAPGCALDGAWPDTGEPFTGWVGGTSPAAAMVSAALALLRSYRPDLTWDQAEALLRASGTASPDGPVVDVEEAFREAGLGALVDAAKAREPAVAAPTIEPDSTSTPPARAPGPEISPEAAGGIEAAPVIRRYPRPQIARLSWRRGRLRVAVTNRPRDAALVVELDRAFAEFGYRRLQIIRRGRDEISAQLTCPKRCRLGLTYARRGHPDKTSVALYRWLR
jgi:hypothetical protein